MCPGPFKLSLYKLYIVLWVAQVIDYMRLIIIYCLHGSGTRVCCANVTDTGGCVNFTYSGSHTMHICHNISTVHWLEWPPPKVVYQPNCECGVPFMTKEMLYGIGLPLDVPLPHALWMMPHGWVCCVMACCLVLQSQHPIQRMLCMHNIRLQGSYIYILHHIIKCKLLW